MGDDYYEDHCYECTGYGDDYYFDEESRMSDLISRKALCEYALNQKDKSVTPNDIMRFPSAQPEKRTEKRTETHACDLIYRSAAVDAIDKALSRTFAEPCGEMILKDVPSAQPELRWIPVTDGLPAYGEDVLISIGGYCNVGHIVSVNEEEQYNWYFSGWYHLPNDVDAWMPLPEPYREGEQDEDR